MDVLPPLPSVKTGQQLSAVLKYLTLGFHMFRLVCICFPTPGRGLPYGSGLGLSRCLGPGECLHSFIHSYV